MIFKKNFISFFSLFHIRVISIFLTIFENFCVSSSKNVTYLYQFCCQKKNCHWKYRKKNNEIIIIIITNYYIYHHHIDFSDIRYVKKKNFCFAYVKFQKHFPVWWNQTWDDENHHNLEMMITLIMMEVISFTRFMAIIINLKKNQNFFEWNSTFKHYFMITFHIYFSYSNSNTKLHYRLSIRNFFFAFHF